MKLLYEHPKANLQYNEDTNAIELIWKEQQDEETYKFMYQKGLEYLIEYKASAWLSDIRNEGVVNPLGAVWLQEEIIPKALAYGLKKAAVLMDFDIFKQFYIQDIQKNTQKGMLEYFGDIETVTAWLKHDMQEK